MSRAPSDRTILKRLIRQLPNWAHTDAQQRCRYNQHNYLCSLDLSKLGLTTLPPDVAALCHLEVLDLRNNLLTHLDVVYATMSNLTAVLADPRVRAAFATAERQAV